MFYRDQKLSNVDIQFLDSFSLLNDILMICRNYSQRQFSRGGWGVVGNIIYSAYGDVPSIRVYILDFRSITGHIILTELQNWVRILVGIGFVLKVCQFFPKNFTKMKYNYCDKNLTRIINFELRDSYESLRNWNIFHPVISLYS